MDFKKPQQLAGAPGQRPGHQKQEEGVARGQAALQTLFGRTTKFDLYFCGLPLPPPRLAAFTIYHFPFPFFERIGKSPGMGFLAGHSGVSSVSGTWTRLLS